MSKANNAQINEVLKIIKSDSRIVFLCDLKKALGISNATFYRWYPKGTADYDNIIEALEDNRTVVKQQLRDRFLESKSAAERIALYRLLATPEERKALNQRDEEQNDKPETERIVLKIN